PHCLAATINPARADAFTGGTREPARARRDRADGDPVVHGHGAGDSRAGAGRNGGNRRDLRVRRFPGARVTASGTDRLPERWGGAAEALHRPSRGGEPWKTASSSAPARPA